MSACGTYAGYQRGCRCDACREACRLYMRDYRRRTDNVAQRVRSQAERALVSYIIAEMPDVWRGFLEDARREAGLPVEVGPGGQFTKPIDHGTHAGYQAHRYRDEPPCDACRAGAAKYEREWRARKAAS